MIKIWYSGHKSMDQANQAWSVKLPNGEHIQVRDIRLEGVSFHFNPTGNAPHGWIELDSRWKWQKLDKASNTIYFAFVEEPS